MRAGIAGLAVALMLAGCSGDGESATPMRVDLSRGYASVQVPFQGGAEPLVVAAGRHVVVYGGLRFSRHNTREVGVNGGVDFDIDRSEWTTIPPAPFERPLYHAAAVWSGREVIVIGTPCGVTTTETELARCTHATITAAAYSPYRHRWRRLRSPRPSMFPTLSVGVPLQAVDVGWIGTDAVFALETADPANGYAMFNPQTGRWRFVPELRFASERCVVDERLVAAAVGDTVPNPVSGFPTPPLTGGALPPVRALTLSADGREWEALGSSLRSHAAPMFDRFACDGRQLGYFPIFPPPVGFGAGGLWYDPTRHRWDPLPDLNALGFPGDPQIGELDGTRIVWIGGTAATKVIETPAQTAGGSSPANGAPVPPTRVISTRAADGVLLVLRSGSVEWVRPKPPIPGSVRLAALDDLILVIPSGSHDARRATIGLFDPARYLKDSVGTSK